MQNRKQTAHTTQEEVEREKTYTHSTHSIPKGILGLEQRTTYKHHMSVFYNNIVHQLHVVSPPYYFS